MPRFTQDHSLFHSSSCLFFAFPPLLFSVSTPVSFCLSFLKRTREVEWMEDRDRAGEIFDARTPSAGGTEESKEWRVNNTPSLDWIHGESGGERLCSPGYGRLEPAGGGSSLHPRTVGATSAEIQSYSRLLRCSVFVVIPFFFFCCFSLYFFPRASI